MLRLRPRARRDDAIAAYEKAIELAPAANRASIQRDIARLRGGAGAAGASAGESAAALAGASQHFFIRRSCSFRHSFMSCPSRSDF